MKNFFFASTVQTGQAGQCHTSSAITGDLRSYKYQTDEKNRNWLGTKPPTNRTICYMKRKKNVTAHTSDKGTKKVGVKMNFTPTFIFYSILFA